MLAALLLMTFVVAILLLRRRASACILLHLLKSVERVPANSSSPELNMSLFDLRSVESTMFASSLHTSSSFECF